MGKQPSSVAWFQCFSVHLCFMAIRPHASRGLPGADLLCRAREQPKNGKWRVGKKKTPQKTQKTPHHAQRHGHANTGSRTPIIRACLSIEIPPTSLLLHLAKSFQRTKGCDTEASAGPDSSLHLSLPTSAGDPGLMRSHARAPLSPACT